MITRALIFVFCLIAGFWCSTILVVAKVGSAAFSSKDYFLVSGIKIFPPWQWAKWFYFYGPKGVFASTMWPIYTAILVGVALAWFSRLFLDKKRPSVAHGSSRWAIKSEISSAGLFKSDGAVLGQSIDGNELICHNGPEHILAVAPTRGGKGVGLVIPTLLNWRESAVIFDPKGENWQVTSGYRSSLGKCFYFDPTSQSTARFNPLMEIRKGDLEVKDAQNIADIIVDPDGRIDSRNHWQNAAHSLLVGTIIYVLYHYPRKSLSGVMDFLTKPESSFEKCLEEMMKSEHLVVKSVAQEMLNKHVEERSGVLSTAISLLSIFRDPLVAKATDGHDFTVSSLKDDERPVSLYLILPPSDLSRLRILLRILLNQMGRILTEQCQPNFKSRRILFLLDEFPALGRLEFFESALAYMAGYGIKAYLICQSLNQLQKAYGERNSILDNCHVRVVFANNDDHTARRFSDLLGDQTLTKEQMSISGGRFDMVKQSSSVSNIEFARKLLLPSEINRLPQDQEIILVNGMFPILAHKVRYYEDKRFKNLVLPAFAQERRWKTESRGEHIKEAQSAPAVKDSTLTWSSL